MKAKSNTQSIPLAKISDNAIKIANIRTVDLNSPSSLMLKKQLEIEGQKVPILIRKLRDDEIGDDEMEFGILDGHHRVAELRELGMDMVEAEIVESNDEITDLIISATPNFSQKYLEGWQIGGILVQLKNLTKRKLEYIAEDFGIARSTAFKYQAAYLNRQSKNSDEKPSKESVQYSREKFSQALEKMKETNQASTNTLESCDEQLQCTKNLETQLSAYKRYLREEIKRLKNTAVA